MNDKNRPPFSVLDAMADRQLFGRTFKSSLLRGDTWASWKVFLRALFGLDLDGDALATFQKHTGRDVAPGEQFREAFVIAGRRSGKSIIAALIGTYLAAFRDYSEFLAPGETAVLPIIAPDRRQCRIILGYIAGFFESSPMLRSKVEARLKEAIQLKNRVRIEVHTASFRSVRGYTAIGGILDEVAFLSAENSANPASELLAALGPAMSTIPNALLLGISSPYARRGVLWDAFREHFGKSDSAVLVWKGDTRSMNPNVSRLVIEAALLRDRAAASAEYLAEFRSDIESFIDAEVIEARTVPGRLELAYHSAHQYMAFADPSGGRSDSFTLAVAHVENDRAVLDCLREAKAPFSPESVTAEFAVTLKSYHVSTVEGDKYAGEWPREAFQKNGISYRVAEHSKSEMYLELLPALMSAQVELLDNQRLATQLVSLERRTARAGRDSVDHPPNSHDDLANVAAGALSLALRSEQMHGLLRFWKQQATEIKETPESPETPEQAFKSRADAGMQASPDPKVRHVFGAQAHPYVAAKQFQAAVVAQTPKCPNCQDPNLSRCAVAGPSGDILETCGTCGWSQIVARPVGRRRA